MIRLLGFIIGVIVTAILLSVFFTFMWYLFVVAAIVAVSGLVWRAVTQH
jgi:uncharacterized membrane protein (DUF106 family)